MVVTVTTARAGGRVGTVCGFQGAFPFGLSILYHNNGVLSICNIAMFLYAVGGQSM